MLIEQIILERYVNAVGFDNEAIQTKNKYKDAVWNMLQKSYAAIGGIKGSGFESPAAMVEKIPMWKIAIKDGRPVAVIMYKDKGGRKSVAVGTDGSDQGAGAVNDMFKNEITRSYGEKSKSALGKALKLIPWDVLKGHIVLPDRVAEMMPEDRVIPIKDVPKSEWPGDAQLTLKRFPQLIDYGYLRDIGGQMIFKVMLGTPGKTIK